MPKFLFFSGTPHISGQKYEKCCSKSQFCCDFNDKPILLRHYNVITMSLQCHFQLSHWASIYNIAVDMTQAIALRMRWLWDKLLMLTTALGSPQMENWEEIQQKTGRRFAIQITHLHFSHYDHQRNMYVVITGTGQTISPLLLKWNIIKDICEILPRCTQWSAMNMAH